MDPDEFFLYVAVNGDYLTLLIKKCFVAVSISFSIPSLVFIVLGWGSYLTA